MTTIQVDNLQHQSREYLLPLTQLRQRTIKEYRQTYQNGSWEPNDSYNWAPGLWVDYQPASASSRIRCTWCFNFAHSDGHAISHCIFYTNGSTEQGRHSISGQSPEYRHTYVWEFNSWGTSRARIGYQIRRYGGSNRPRFFGTHHWDGVGSNQTGTSQIFIEEYLPIT
jgi:hypothetical protein